MVLLKILVDYNPDSSSFFTRKEVSSQRIADTMQSMSFAFNINFYLICMSNLSWSQIIFCGLVKMTKFLIVILLKS